MVDKIMPNVEAIVEVVKAGDDIAKDIRKTDELVKDKNASTADKIVASIGTAAHIASDLAEIGAKIAPVVSDDVEVAKGCFACCMPSPKTARRREKRKVPCSPTDETVEDAEAPAKKKKKKKKAGMTRTLSSVEKVVIEPTKHAPPSPAAKPADKPQ